MLSTTKRCRSSHLLRTAYYTSVHTLCMDLATRIRLGRKAKDISQRELARRIGVTPSAVAQWETSVTAPTLGNRVDLARLLSIDFIDLLPEAANALPVSVTAPQTVVLVKHFEELPAPVREAILMQVVATAASLKGRPPE